MTDEHARFIATGYTEERWQRLLQSRERFRLKMIALRDWGYEHPIELRETPNTIVKATSVKQPIVKVETAVPQIRIIDI
jgi:hypothetical protein